MKSLPLVVSLALGLSAAAWANGKDKAARELVALTFTEESWNKMMAMTSGQLPPQARDEVMKMISYQEMVELQLGLYRKYYEEAELKELAAFYKTPLGQKALRIMPEIAQDTQLFVMGKLQQELPAMLERMRNPESAPKPADKARPGKR